MTTLKLLNFWVLLCLSYAYADTSESDMLKERVAALETSSKQIVSFIASEAHKQYGRRLQSLEQQVHNLQHMVKQLQEGHHHCCHVKSHQHSNASTHESTYTDGSNETHLHSSHHAGHKHSSVIKSPVYLSAIWNKIRGGGGGHHQHDHSAESHEEHQSHHVSYNHSSSDPHHLKYHVHNARSNHSHSHHNHDEHSHHKHHMHNMGTGPMDKKLTYREYIQKYELAECEMRPNKNNKEPGFDNIKGQVYFRQEKDGSKPLDIMIMLTGFSHQYGHTHGFHIHQSGDLSNGCDSTGGHYNPDSSAHGGKTDSVRHAGDLGNIVCDKNGDVFHKMTSDKVSIVGKNTIIGRSLVISKNPSSAVEGNSGPRIACCLIKRKVFETSSHTSHQ